MAIIIQEAYGLAQKSGIRALDKLKSINNHPIRDFIDLEFYGADNHLEILIERDAKLLSFSIDQDWQSPLGIRSPEHIVRTCANDCIFCFVDQMHPALRPSLYIKDDDYLFSFVWGNFITLTNLAKRDFDKIIKQKLSPLYISVHTTNTKLHKQMLAYQQDFNILEKLQLLAAAKIELHTQIVIVPGYNDNEELERSLADLSNIEQVASIGVVPVGITKFLDKLKAKAAGIRPLTRDEAIQTIKIVDKFREQNPSIWCSDELYLMSNTPLPDDAYYDDYSQIENGIGMVRTLLSTFENAKAEFAQDINTYSHVHFICGMLIYPHIKDMCKQINQLLAKQTCHAQAIINNFFGPTVTVSGLLTATDIIAQLDCPADALLALPASMFNDNDLSIDEMGMQTLANHLGRDIMLIDEYFNEWKLIKKDK